MKLTKRELQLKTEIVIKENIVLIYSQKGRWELQHTVQQHGDVSAHCAVSN